ncbi:MAG: carbohydrate esterase family 4 protein [Linnemannia gamsii]|nr:MAG: carbohydrate esterase family 4 protein [Linnemannia gamsii]
MIPPITPMAATAALLLSVVAKNTFAQAAAKVYSSCIIPNTVALTFDNGPYIYMDDVVNQLKAAGAKGTFFINGYNFDCIYNSDAMKRVQHAYANGHQIASHTWSHKDLTTLSWDQIHDEMGKVEKAIQNITGALVAFMRPPYGSYNDLVLQAAGVRHQSVALWDFDTGDEAGATPGQSKAAVDELIRRHPQTALVLATDTVETTVRQVLPYAIEKLQGAGYKLVTLAECLGLPAYQSVGAPSVPDGTWTC